MKLTTEQRRKIVDAMVHNELTPQMHWVIGAGLGALSRLLEEPKNHKEILKESGTYLRDTLKEI